MLIFTPRNIQIVLLNKLFDLFFYTFTFYSPLHKMVTCSSLHTHTHVDGEGPAAGRSLVNKALNEQNA